METLVDVDDEEITPGISKLFAQDVTLVTSPNKKAMEATLKLIQYSNAVNASSFEDNNRDQAENIKISSENTSQVEDRQINGPVVEDEQLKKVRSALPTEFNNLTIND